jgi:Polysaccharide deacetylase
MNVNRRDTLKKWLFLLMIVVIAWGIFYLMGGLRGGQIHRFAGVAGPAERSVVAAEIATPWTQFDHGSPSRLAVLLTDTESSWLGLAHGLKSIGVPFRITRDYREAIKHKAILVYPNISGSTLEGDALKALAQFARERGTLMGSHVVGGGMNELFGFEEARVAKHTIVQFDTSQRLASTFTDPKESTIPVGNAAKPETLVGTYGYTNPQNPPLALFEDGSAAITQKHFSNGRAYALGMDLGFLLLKGYNNREEGISRSYANDFEPTLDVLMRLIKNMYLEANPDAVTLGTVPFGKSLSAVITHDIDYNRSLKNAVTFAEFERSEAIPATHFIQTKYIRDWNDEIFFNDEGITYLNDLNKFGVEIASHSVSHSRVMSKFDLGNGTEQYPSYQPFVKAKTNTVNATVLGELRVSKFLLDKFTPNGNVVSFRPGHLQNPFTLPQALQAAGYRYSSSVTANTSLTHLPFRLNHSRGVIGETAMFEFPVTVEDELIKDGGLWLSTSIDLSKKISRYGGSFVVLIHTNVTNEKLSFQRNLINAIKPYSWFGSLRDFGSWWSARDDVECDVTSEQESSRIVSLNLPQRINGLTLNLPKGWRWTSAEPASLKAKQTGNSLVIDTAEGAVTLHFTR